MSEPSIFTRIRNGEIPSEIIAETENAFAIRDIAPKAPTHLLILPEHHIDTFRDVGELEADEAKRMLEFVAESAAKAGLEDYRLIVNVGPGGGQTVFHLHWHLLGGASLPGFE